LDVKSFELGSLANRSPRLAASRDARESALGLYLQFSTDELTRLALGSQDPQVYALALQSCRFRGDSTSCALLSADRWAELEPENGAPWLLVANAAHWRRDGVSRDLAVYRASNAKYFDAHFPNFPALLQSPDIQKQAPQTRSLLAEDLLAMRLTQTELPYSAFFSFCNVPSVAEPSHIYTCSDLTKLLVEHDRTMMGLSVAAKLAQSANWPPDAVNSLHERRTAYEAALTAAVPLGGDRPKSDCEQVADLEHWAADYARLGDRGVAMKFIETFSARDR
jgi:hypothetical protein